MAKKKKTTNLKKFKEQINKNAAEKMSALPVSDAVKKREKGEKFVKAPHEFYLTKNMEAMKALGWDQSGLLEMIKKTEPVQIAVDPDIIIQGCKNPMIQIHLGFSTRHIYEAIRRKKKITKYTCIIEPNLGVFKHLMCSEDLSDLLLDENIDFIVGIDGENLVPYLYKQFCKPVAKGFAVARNTMLESMEIVLDPFQFDTPEKLESGKKYVDVIKRASMQVKLSMGCSDDQFRRFELLIANKQNMYNAWNFKELYNKFKDIPAIVLGGGPSIENFIKVWKERPEIHNSIIIAPDAVLYKLLNNGIKPHLVTRCERKLTNIFKGVTKEMTDGIYYCAYPWTPPEFFDLFDNYFYLFRQNGVCLFTELSHGFVDGGVSSSNAALEIAFNLGCRNVILSGIDLCMVDGKTHVEGTQVEFDINKSKAKWTKVRTNSGEEVTTIPVWERCRHEYSQAILKWKDKGKEINIYNTSWNGAAINLTEYKPFKDLVSIFNNNVDVPSIITKCNKKLPNEEIAKFENKLIETVEKLKEYKNIVTIASNLAEDAKATTMREIHKIIEIIKKSTPNAYEHIKAIRQNQPNYDKLWGGVADQFELNFRQKLYPEYLFRVLIFDVLQLDLYHYENAITKTHNLRNHKDEKSETTYIASRDFLSKVDFYLDMFIKLFSDGLDPKSSARISV